MRPEFFISILTGAVAPNESHFAPDWENAQCTEDGLEVERGCHLEPQLQTAHFQ